MFSCLFVLLPLVAISFGQHLIDGYIAYCPCMGRFGNQADHFLGALAFSKALNRTLIVPPWVEYRKGEMRSIQVPYETYFKLESLGNYHSVVSMETFIKEVASTIWPPGQRISFCYMERKSLNPENVHKDCYAKDGNPFGPFWDTFAIDFVGSEFFGPLHYDVHHSDAASKWGKNYPAEKWPVLAFTGAPGSFPVQLENRNLQRFVVWNEKYDQMANDFIKNVLPKGAFIGIHLRNGVDWVKACEHIQTSHNLFASPQCLGYNNEKGNANPELCMPSREAVIRQIKRLIKKVKETNKSNEIRSIFVASDNNHLIPELNEALSRMKISAFKQGGVNDPHLDLAILGRSNHFIGNCVSSFSAFVKRERDVRGFPSYFWAFPKEKDRSEKKIKHEEL